MRSHVFNGWCGFFRFNRETDIFYWYVFLHNMKSLYRFINKVFLLVQLKMCLRTNLYFSFNCSKWILLVRCWEFFRCCYCRKCTRVFRKYPKSMIRECFKSTCIPVCVCVCAFAIQKQTWSSFAVLDKVKYRLSSLRLLYYRTLVIWLVAERKLTS